MSTHVRVPADAAERAALEAVLRESFGADDLPWAGWMDALGHDALRVVVEDGVVRGGLGYYRFGQWWGGARVPLVGLAGVGITPAARGRGLARAVVESTLRDARAAGVPLAALYATSSAVYRACGFEQAGTVMRYAAPLAGLPPGDVALACEPFDPVADPRPRPLFEARARATNGHLDRGDVIWSRVTRRGHGPTRGYLFGPRDAPEGYVIYGHAPSGEGYHFHIAVRDLVLATPAAARRCLSLFAGLRSLAGELRWLGCASDPLVSLMPEPAARVTELARWMLRIVDPVSAFAARGYGADGAAHVDVRDALLGDVGLSVRVAAGRAEVSALPFGGARVRLDVRALAALYTGFARPGTLVAMGLVEGDAAEAESLARLCAGPEPWLSDWF